VQRYETKPGEQMQFDWAEFTYEQDRVKRKLYGFAAILCYSRMRFVTFDFSFQPSLSERLLWELADLSFIQRTTNVIFLDPPVLGKHTFRLPSR